MFLAALCRSRNTGINLTIGWSTTCLGRTFQLVSSQGGRAECFETTNATARSMQWSWNFLEVCKTSIVRSQAGARRQKKIG